MRIKIQQFLFGKSHSWSIVSQNIGRALIKKGHEVDFISTDGFNEKYCPPDLRPYAKLTDVPTDQIAHAVKSLGKYDCQISYTAPHNWGVYLANGTKNKFAIWNYEYNSKNVSSNLLQGFAKYYKNTTKVLPSSNFAKEIFINMGIPEEKQVVIPHGINLEDYNTSSKTQLKTKASKKILLNVAQPHKRKALHLALEAYGKAFNKNDDVCLVAKVLVSNKSDKGQAFDVDFFQILKTFKDKFKNHAEIEVYTGFIPNIAEMYNACDINFSATFCEAFHLPSIESLACVLINVVPNYGGQLDFCNSSNSLLINGEEVRAPRDHQYWSYNPYGVHFKVDTDHAASLLQKAVSEYDSLKKEFSPNMKSTAEKFTWDSAVNSLLNLCE